MNILLIARYPVGGIKTYFRYIYGAEKFSHANITLMARSDGLADFLKCQLPDGRIKLIDLPTEFFGFYKVLNHYLRNNRVDVVHSHGFSASLFVQLTMIFSKIPHFMTAHDVFLEDTFAGFKGFVKRIAIGWLLNNVTRVLSVSEDARQNILQHFPSLSADRVLNITNGIDTRLFANAKKRNLHSELNLPESQKLFGFFGRFMAQKGFRQIIGAMELLRQQFSDEDMPIVITFGWGGFIREDFTLIEQKGLSQFFVQLPGTDNMGAAIRGVDCVLMPSRWEACPLLPMEVLCCGVPIIGSNCIGLREVLTGTPAKMIPVGDLPALTAAMAEQLAVGPEPFVSFQNSAVERFDASHHVEQLNNLYLKTVEDSVCLND